MIHNATELQAAIDALISECDPGIDRLRELADKEEDYRVTRSLRELAEMARVLRRLIPDLTPVQVHRCFGAPGDFGYERPLGAALANTYRGAP